MKHVTRLIMVLVLPLLVAGLLRPIAVSAANPWADWVEPDLPFFSSVLDGRHLGPGWPTNNLTPRALILNLGHGCWAAFDTELLRVAAVWRGPAPVNAISMSQMSYQTVGDKPDMGQKALPRPQGVVWLANGVHPGWQRGEMVSLTDPREPGPDPAEVGRGPLPGSPFKAVRLVEGGVRLDYELDGVPVRERITARLQDGKPVVQREVRLERVAAPLWWVLGQRPASASGKLTFTLDGSTNEAARLEEPRPGLHAVRLRPSDSPVTLRVAVSMADASATVRTWSSPDSADTGRRWPDTLITSGTLSTNQDAYVVDDIALPLRNPWRRNIRLADVAFFRDGRAAAVSFDGDVWLISGLGGDLKQVSWKRFASGLHEPLGLTLRDEQIFVFDRNGLWRLTDSDGNGEADTHELFSNVFRQTAETREYAGGVRVAPDGSFVIAKGGIQVGTVGRDNGTVLRVAPDGKSFDVLGWGLREPFIGVHPRSGLVTASDQQGEYVPATPIHIIRDRQYHGHLPSNQPRNQHPAPIAEPMLWIPHPINASAVGQVWLTDAEMGPLNDHLIHIGYYRPELFVVTTNGRAATPQAAIVSLTRDLAFAPLNGAVNPTDGQLYVTGFKIWGTTAEAVSGLARLRHTGAPVTLPVEVAAMEQGLLLRFHERLDAKRALDLGNFSIERWNYQRTHAYGSPHFTRDGGKGQETLVPSSAYLSRDGKAVFVGVPGMEKVMQMRVGFALATADGRTFERNAYLTPHALTPFKPEAEGFETLTVDLTPRALLAAEDTTPVTAAEGERLYELMGCVACHSTDGSTLGKIGPSFKGVFGQERVLANGQKILADEAYLLESIKEPAAKLVRGFDRIDNAMPSYEGIMTENQMRAVIEYLKTLR